MRSYVSFLIVNDIRCLELLRIYGRVLVGCGEVKDEQSKLFIPWDRSKFHCDRKSTYWEISEEFWVFHYEQRSLLLPPTLEYEMGERSQLQYVRIWISYVCIKSSWVICYFSALREYFYLDVATIYCRFENVVAWIYSSTFEADSKTGVCSKYTKK